MQLNTEILADQFHLLDKLKALDKASWPEFLCHGDLYSWNKIYDILPHYVLLMIDSDENLAAAGFTIPALWDGGIGELPATIESIIVQGLEVGQGGANTLMAIAALVDRRFRGRGLSARILTEMKGLAQQYALSDLLVPVRPTWKSRYPLQPLDRYITWQTADGLFYDPWLRTHQRLGAEVMTCVDSTLCVEGTIAQWSTWTQMVFPESGGYVVPGALQPVTIDVASDKGIYHDPNVWMRHRVTE